MVEYWEARYAERPLERAGKAVFEEWYAPYSAMRDVLLPLLKPTDRILHVGCGQSRLGFDLYADGFCNVLNMDISEACVSQLAARYANSAPKMHFRVMDMMDLECEDETVEMIVDKGGIDALMCTGSTLANAEACIAEFLRVLVPGGSYFVATRQARTTSVLGQQTAGWKVKVQEVDVPQSRPLTIIVLTKRGPPSTVPTPADQPP